MALKDFVPPSKAIKAGDTEFSVRGLSMQDIVYLIDSHREEMELLFSGRAHLPSLIHENQDFVGHAIAYAADEPDEIEQAKKLPLGIQVEAFLAIWEMSQIDTEELGNVLSGFVTGATVLRQELSGVSSLVSSSTASISKSQPKPS